VIERVYIETDSTLDDVQTALMGNGITVTEPPSDGEPQGHPHKFAADVPDSRDAVEEVTDKLNDAGIDAYVYE
jgi:hypothetical protein